MNLESLVSKLQADNFATNSQLLANERLIASLTTENSDLKGETMEKSLLVDEFKKRISELEKESYALKREKV